MQNLYVPCVQIILNTHSLSVFYAYVVCLTGNIIIETVCPVIGLVIMVLIVLGLRRRDLRNTKGNINGNLLHRMYGNIKNKIKKFSSMCFIIVIIIRVPV